MTTIDERTASTAMTAHVAPGAGETIVVKTIRFVVDHDAPVSIAGNLNDSPVAGASWGTGKGSAEFSDASPSGDWLTLSGDAGDKLSFQADVDGVVTVTVEGP